ncbi:ribonuclease P protein subunit p25-like protein [Cimex lectularius]|uniref:DNA/RNA-binding protein Alba-like domain-containing protein n=1 Tax=Cimex lectularius TaxID=79782 RepID=A0A8I6RCZ6_CIMLE|nr:ribonuclease P protein subunit p25-like protein [Cimex lectularius]
MDNYTKGDNVEEPLEIEKIPIPNLPKNVLWMQVRGGSKIRNLLDVALKAYENESRDVLWTASGPAVGKAVTCAEIVKRKFKGVHQFNHICYRRCEEYWEPKISGLDRLVVNRDVPMIHILLSHEAINEGAPGYQFEQQQGADKPFKPRGKPYRKPANFKQMENFGLRFDKRKKAKDSVGPKD